MRGYVPSISVMFDSILNLVACVVKDFSLWGSARETVQPIFTLILSLPSNWLFVAGYVVIFKSVFPSSRGECLFNV